MGYATIKPTYLEAGRMLEYFWRQQDDIPAGMGYPLFGVAHLISVAVTLGLVILTVVLSQRIVGIPERSGNAGKRDSVENKGNSTQRKLLRAIPLIMLFLELLI